MERKQNIFKVVGNANVKRSMFDLSHEHKFTGVMGKLYPIMQLLTTPSDHIKLQNQVVVRFQPMVAPLLHEVNVYTHYFNVPLRLLFDTQKDAETFFTGGVTGDLEVTPPKMYTPLDDPNFTDIGTLWDAFGFPTGIENPDGINAVPVSALPWRAYNLVYNEYYRDENLSPEVDRDSNIIQHRAWEKDYFTAALPWQQRGTAPAISLGGAIPLRALVTLDEVRDLYSDGIKASGIASSSMGNQSFAFTPEVGSGSNPGSLYSNSSGLYDHITGGNPSEVSWLAQFGVDLSEAGGFDINEIRYAFAVQRILERNARAGNRYTEWLRAHFGVAPRDERLQRPEYLGGSMNGVVFSEVLQTSSTNAESPQGTLAGHGLSASEAYCFKTYITEPSVIIGILSVMPKAAYANGFNRQWTKETRYDYFMPELSYLGEQAIYNYEIYAKSFPDPYNRGVFGYQGAFNEYRFSHSYSTGQLRPKALLDYWTLTRSFDDEVYLNDSFVKCVPRTDIFAVQDEDNMIFNVGFKIHAVRPLPFIAEPGLVDHV